MFTACTITLIIVSTIIVVMSMFETDAFNVELLLFNNTRVIRLKYLLSMFLFVSFGICIKYTYDLGNYRSAYDQRISHGKEPFFDVIRFFFRDHGVSFDTFKTIWVVIVAVLLYFGIKRYCKVPEQVVALTLVLVLFSFIIQMRSAMALAIILNAFPLLYSGRKADKLLYAIIVLMCGQFHIVSYIFLLLIIVRNSGSRRYKGTYYILVGIVTIIAVLMNTFLIDIVTSVVSILSDGSSMARRIIDSISGVGAPFKSALFNICKQLALFVLTDRACAMQISSASDSERQRLCVISEINTLSLLFIPICIVNEAFMRLFNPIAILQYAMILNVGHNRTEITKNLGLNLTMKTTLVFYTIIVLYFTIHGNLNDYIVLLNGIRW